MLLSDLTQNSCGCHSDFMTLMCGILIVDPN